MDEKTKALVEAAHILLLHEKSLAESKVPMLSIELLRVALFDFLKDRAFAHPKTVRAIRALRSSQFCEGNP